ncbi:uncharacterized protein LOC126737749 [Anthonomus grandis grandis]|uniref:uncharacterized protein LOC126737749 n=1 Tax=Anthonomus grandis grandis TaxID=2921223 RepID=UPI0021657BCB|nr:uncharacterized protein LOC126737749 [Anthonomus grandis grandis]
MKSRRKNISYRTTQQYSSTYSSKIPISVKQTSSVTIQTDNILTEELCFFENQPVEKIKENYEKCLLLINKIHEYINDVLSKCDKATGFLVPTVPDYFKIADFILKYNKVKQTQDLTNEQKAELDALKSQENAKNMFDSQQFSPISIIGDGPIQNKQCQFLNEDATFFEKFPVSHNINTLNKKPIALSQPIINLSEDNTKKPISTTFEEILKTCNEVKNMSIENLLQNDVPLIEPPTTKPDLKKYIKKHNLEQGDQSISDINKEKIDNTDSSFNLFEYALKKCKPYQTNPSSPKIPDIENNNNSIENNQDVPKNCVKVLNDSNQSRMPQKISEMFRKISRENIGKSTKTSDELQRIEVENQPRDNNRAFFQISTRTEHEGEICLCKNINLWKPQSISPNNLNPNYKLDESQTNSETSIQNFNMTNPLKLSDRDKARANAKALKDIGLFTEKGDMRPSVMNFIKNTQRSGFIQNDSRNMKFKSQRKFDLQVKFNNPNATSARTSSEKLGSSGSINDLQNQDSDENISIYSSQNTVISTVSDSDFIGLYDVGNTSIANTTL